MTMGGDQELIAGLRTKGGQVWGALGVYRTPGEKQMARGKDKTAALRLLRRQLSDAVFTALRADQLATQTEPSNSVNAA
jgi:transposase